MTRSNGAEIVRFALVGVSSTGLYFFLLWLLRNAIANTALLTACCYLVSMMYNFVLQNWFTFRAGRPTAKSAGRFVAMHLGAMVTNSVMMSGLVDGFGLPLFGAQIVVTAFVSAAVYILSKAWVYRPG